MVGDFPSSQAAECQLEAYLKEKEMSIDIKRYIYRKHPPRVTKLWTNLAVTILDLRGISSSIRGDSVDVLFFMWPTFTRCGLSQQRFSKMGLPPVIIHFNTVGFSITKIVQRAWGTTIDRNPHIVIACAPKSQKISVLIPVPLPPFWQPCGSCLKVYIPLNPWVIHGDWHHFHPFSIFFHRSHLISLGGPCSNTAGVAPGERSPLPDRTGSEA